MQQTHVESSRHINTLHPVLACRPTVLPVATACWPMASNCCASCTDDSALAWVTSFSRLRCPTRKYRSQHMRQSSCSPHLIRKAIAAFHTYTSGANGGAPSSAASVIARLTCNSSSASPSRRRRPELALALEPDVEAEAKPPAPQGVLWMLATALVYVVLAPGSAIDIGCRARNDTLHSGEATTAKINRGGLGRQSRMVVTHSARSGLR